MSEVLRREVDRAKSEVGRDQSCSNRALFERYPLASSKQKDIHDPQISFERTIMDGWSEMKMKMYNSDEVMIILVSYHGWMVRDEDEDE